MASKSGYMQTVAYQDKQIARERIHTLRESKHEVNIFIQHKPVRK